MAFSKTSTSTKKRRPRRRLIIGLVVVLLLAGGAAAWQQHKTSANQAKSSTTAKKKPQPVASKGTQPLTIANKQSGGAVAASDTATITNTPPAKPFGTFVSNHKPGQNGSPLQEESLCNTSAGITCAITFTKDGTVKSLPAKKTDADGSASWSWTPQSLGLTPGNWTVTAIASSGQQTASTQDPVVLEVSP